MRCGCNRLCQHINTTTATRSGKKLSDVRKNEDLRWCHADGVGADGTVTGCKVQTPADGAGRGKVDKGRCRGQVC